MRERDILAQKRSSVLNTLVEVDCDTTIYSYTTTLLNSVRILCAYTAAATMEDERQAVAAVGELIGQHVRVEVRGGWMDGWMDG